MWTPGGAARVTAHSPAYPTQPQSTEGPCEHLGVHSPGSRAPDPTHGLSRWTAMSQRWAPTQHSALSVTAPQTRGAPVGDRWRDGQDTHAPSCPGIAHLSAEGAPCPGFVPVLPVPGPVSHTGLLPESASTKKCLSIFLFYQLMLEMVGPGPLSWSRGVLPHPRG